jgi:hypothetical protein
MSIKLINSAESGWAISAMDKSQLITEIPQGKLYRKRLNSYAIASDLPHLPEIMATILIKNDPQAKEKRRILMRKLIRNSPNNFPLISKPSSCFIFRDQKGAIFIDYLIESSDNEREGTTLHGFLREHPLIAASYKLENLFARENDSLISGHIADLTKEYCSPKFSHIFLIDKFSSDSPLNKKEQFILKVILGNGILPVSAEAKLIDPFCLHE